MSVSVETKSRDDGALVLALAGELDMESAPSVEERLLAAEDDRPDRIVLDLRDLRFIDSTGLSVVINADRRARRSGRHVTVVSGTGATRRILETVGLEDSLDVVRDLPNTG